MLLPHVKADSATVITVGVAGTGALGRYVCARLLEGLPGLALRATASRTAAARPEFLRNSAVPNVTLQELPALADVVVECLSPEAFREIAIPTLHRGRTLVVISSGALLLNPDILELPGLHAGQIVLPCGALPGLDGVRAACEGGDVSALLVTRKPAHALSNVGPVAAPAGVPQQHAHRVFEGNAVEAARAFPRNANIAASVALAGVCAKKITVEIWIDPGLTANVHELTITSDSVTFRVESRNVPSPENPRSSVLAAQSIVAALRVLATSMPGGVSRSRGSVDG